MATPRFPIGADKKESLTQLVRRYKVLSEPRTINGGLMMFTLLQDLKLYKLLKSMPDHPKDTGLLKESWIPPAKMSLNKWGDENYGLDNVVLTEHFGQYKPSLANGRFNVYVLNTATVGEQARRKSGFHVRRKKKLTGRHNLKRYMKWVDKRTKFYTKKLRLVRQQIDKEWKKFVPDYIYFRLGARNM